MSLLAVSICLAACSDDSSGDSAAGTGASTIAEQELTKAEFVAAAEAICAESGDTAGALLPTEAMTAEEVAASLAALADATGAGIDELAEISPPSQEEIYDEWLDALGQSAADVRDAAIALRLGDNAALADRLQLAEAHSLEAVDLATELGLESCRFGAPGPSGG